MTADGELIVFVEKIMFNPPFITALPQPLALLASNAASTAAMLEALPPVTHCGHVFRAVPPAGLPNVFR